MTTTAAGAVRSVGAWRAADEWSVELAPRAGWRVWLGYSRRLRSYNVVVASVAGASVVERFAEGFDDVGELATVDELVGACARCRVGPFADGGAVDWSRELGLRAELAGVGLTGGSLVGAGALESAGWRGLWRGRGAGSPE